MFVWSSQFLCIIWTYLIMCAAVITIFGAIKEAPPSNSLSEALRMMQVWGHSPSCEGNGVSELTYLTGIPPRFKPFTLCTPHFTGASGPGGGGSVLRWQHTLLGPLQGLFDMSIVMPPAEFAKIKLLLTSFSLLSGFWKMETSVEHLGIVQNFFWIFRIF